MEEIFLRLQSFIKEIIQTNLVEMQKIKINHEKKIDRWINK